MTSEHSSNGHGSVSPVGASSGTDTKPLRELVARTRRLLRSTWVLTGLLASFGLGLLLLVGSAMTDFVVSSAAPSDWTWLRTLALVLLVVPTAWAVAVGVLRPLLRRLSNVLVARRIETELPAIHNRLVTCIDLEDEEQRVPVSQAFHRRLVSEALERIREFHPRQVLDIHKLRHAGLVAIVGTLALAVIFIPGVTTAMERVFSPFDDIPPAGHASYNVEVGNTDQMRAGDGSVVRGDDIVFQVKLTGGSLYEDERLELAIETVNDKGEAVTIRHTLPAFAALDDADLSRTVLKGLEHDFHYRVSGGGTYTRRFEVKILARPEIVGVKTELAFPDYMEKQPLVSEVADVEGPVGSTVTVNVKAEGDIKEGWVEFLEARSRRVTVADRPTRTWFAATRPDGSTPSGTWQEESLDGKAAHTDPANSAVHAHGFTKAAEPFQVGTNEVLFADVYLPPDQVPREIMLKWNDGQGWEHRAFWGEDLVGEGKPGTASRYHIGPLPQSGRLVRLEVPAAVVGLAGRAINGMMFTLHGGQAVWGSAGTLPPGEEIRTELVPIKDMKFKLTPTEELKEGQQHFSGTFPLLDNGLYRVQLRNDANRFNKQMAEARIVAIPDSPPQVIIERPRQTLVLSQPQPVPISITSFDDYGVKDIVLSVRIDDQETFSGEPIVTLSPPLQNDHRDVTLDLSQRGLKVGGTLTYRVAVRDGKGQSGQTVDYVIQIKDDKAAEDKQFEQLEKETDTFRDKFIELVAQQKKVQTKSQELEKKYKKLTEKIEKAQDEAAKEQAEKKDPADEKAKKDAKKEKKKDAKEDPDQPKPVELNPEEQKELDALKKEIAELAAQETKNVALAEQVKTDLKTLAEKAEKNQLVPQQVTEQMKQIENAFEKAAIDPLKNLVQQMKQATQPKQQDTALPEINKQAERVQKDLEALKKRMDSLARAQRDSRQDLNQAMKDLKKDLLEQNAELTRDALKELKDYLKAMEKDLKAVMGKQENLLKDSQANLSSEDLKKALQAEQEKLSREAEKKLDKTAKLLDAKRMPRQPFFPGRPYKPEDEAYKVPPKEQDSDPEPEDKKGKKEKDAKDKKKKKKGDKEEPEEEFFLPALGGLRAELDPRFEKMIRQMKKKLEQQKKGEKGDPEQQERNRQQAQRLQELDLAQKALQSDQKSLEQLQQELQQAQQKSQQQQQPQQQQSLEQLMQKALMQQAQKMMKRMQQQGQTPPQQQQQQQQQQQPPEPTLANQLLGNLKPDGQGTEEVLVELSKLDVSTRRVIMKMQPKEREELLQGLREEGPKAYQGFIRDYFKKLSRARAAKPGK